SYGRLNEYRYGVVAQHRYLIAAEASCAELLSDCSHQEQRESESQTHADSVKRGVKNPVFAGEHLSSAEYDAVDYYESKICSERVVQVGHVCVEHHLDRRDKACYYNDI